MPTPIQYKIKNQVIELMPVKGGSFVMGSPESEVGRSNAEVQHPVTVSDFYMAKYPVSQELYFAVTGKSPSYFIGKNRPVEQVSWYDAVEFCNALSLLFKNEGLSPVYRIDKDHKDPNNENKYDELKWTVTIDSNAKGFRLPTEAEWEFAARGGNEAGGAVYSGSNQIEEVAWYGYPGNRFEESKPLGLKMPNALGLYDMSGNVYEWCCDWAVGDYYRSSPQNNPQGPHTGSGRVLRGGSWGYAANCRVANRGGNSPDGCDDDYGFRVAYSGF